MTRDAFRHEMLESSQDSFRAMAIVAVMAMAVVVAAMILVLLLVGML